MAGNTAASNIEGFVSTAMDAFSQAALSFSGQNLGAGKTGRVKKILALCLALVTATGLALGVGAFLLGNQLLGIYSTEAEVLSLIHIWPRARFIQSAPGEQASPGLSTVKGV